MQLTVEGGSILAKNYNALDDYNLNDGSVIIVEQVEKMQRQ
jgi:hypothetical protein